jgi:RNA polymerase sigma factor (sigma-70 family)
MFNELVSDGNISLLASIDNFDVGIINQNGTSNKFSTYATWAISMNFWRRASRPDRVNLDIADPVLKHQVIAPKPPSGVDADEIVIIKEALNKLTDVQRAVLVGRFFRGETLETIGNREGFTKERARQIQITALNRLRSSLQPLAVTHGVVADP